MTSFINWLHRCHMLRHIQTYILYARRKPESLKILGRGQNWSDELWPKGYTRLENQCWNKQPALQRHLDTPFHKSRSSLTFLSSLTGAKQTDEATGNYSCLELLLLQAFKCSTSSRLMLPQASIALTRKPKPKTQKHSTFLKHRGAESHSLEVFWTCAPALERKGQRQATCTERDHTKTSRTMRHKHGCPHQGGLGSQDMGDWKQGCKTLTNVPIFGPNERSRLIILLPKRFLAP